MMGKSELGGSSKPPDKLVGRGPLDLGSQCQPATPCEAPRLGPGELIIPCDPEC